MSITADQLKLIKVLRDTTGASVRLCKKALESNNYSVEAAIDMLRKETANSIFTKKSDRTTGVTKAFADKREDAVALLTLSTETDFVLKAEKFNNLAQELLELCFTEGIKDANTLEKLPETARAIEEAMLIIGEKVSIAHACLVRAKESTDAINYYMHNHKLACVMVLSQGTEADAYQLAVQAVGFQALFVDSLDPDFKQAQIEQSHPEDLARFVKTLEIEHVLTKQPFYANPTISVEQWMAAQHVTIRHMCTNFHPEGRGL
jgi:translation elongation factor EF-Ts